MRVTDRARIGTSRPLAAAVAACALVAALPAFADYKSDYAAGLKAAGDGQWGEVESKMRAALAQESTPAARVNLYGRRFEAYAPQYFLGIAAYRKGDCEGAVRNLEHGPTRAAVADPKAKNTVGDFTALAQRGLSECKTKLAAVSAPPPPVAEPKPVPPPVSEPAKPVADTRPPPVTTPPVVKPTAPPTTTPAKPPVVVASAPPPPKPAEPEKPAAPAAPPALAAAVENFLRGRYDQIVSADPASLPDSRARYHLLLLRSASRHTLAQIQGNAGAALLAQAEADVRSAKQLQPGKSPDAALFSPRYRAFFTATR
ncbi:MAG TPA: hypothetical protein VND91_00895 [Candidatus Saccharimonadia bacterium]|nr:hypothetical protein [Candidatus Saccharimonadia bacterium]